MTHRLPALDWMRGLVMILMTTDHASGALNAGRSVTDSVFLYNSQQAIDGLQFLYRWASHICAPTFLFLAGTSLALSIARKIARGTRAAAIDGDLAKRGLIILCVDLFLVNYFWVPQWFLLQVMYAIGLAMILMIPLRRLTTTWIAAPALLVLIGSELFLGDRLIVPFEPGATLATLLLNMGVIDTPLESLGFLTHLGITDKVAILYPLLPWWAMLALGWVFGRQVLCSPRRKSPARILLFSGVAAILVFVLVRGLNGFGNMRLTRLDGSWLQWLHVSKYPPSLSFTALELGLMGLVLAALFGVQRWRGERTGQRNALLVFGQTAFFFYLAHVVILESASRLLGLHGRCGLLGTLVALVLTLVALYPLCIWYRSFKARHPRSILRFI